MRWGKINRMSKRAELRLTGDNDNVYVEKPGSGGKYYKITK